MEAKQFTNGVGTLSAGNENDRKTCSQGPTALQNRRLKELTHFDRVVIPERRMYAKGWGAYGYVYLYP